MASSAIKKKQQRKSWSINPIFFPLSSYLHFFPPRRKKAGSNVSVRVWLYVCYYWKKVKKKKKNYYPWLPHLDTQVPIEPFFCSKTKKKIKEKKITKNSKKISTTTPDISMLFRLIFYKKFSSVCMWQKKSVPWYILYIRVCVCVCVLLMFNPFFNYYFFSRVSNRHSPLFKVVFFYIIKKKWCDGCWLFFL